MTIGRNLSYRFQAALLRGAFALVRLWPLDWASATGGWLGRTFGPRLRKTDIARRNLAAAFPEFGPERIEAVVRAMWDNLGRTVMEYPHLDTIRVFDDRRVEIVNVEHFDRLMAEGSACILFSAHLANWEMMGLCAAQRGRPIHLVYRAPNNPYLDWLYRHRRSGDAEMIEKGSAGAKKALELLRRGAFLGMLVDQKMNDGIPVPFFGREAMTAPALAQLALRYDCPVLPARIERIGGARFRLTLATPRVFPKTDDRQADVVAAMTWVNEVIEDWIRDKPEQWLWLHRRWPDSR